jgi:UDP-3-O-[3-hydroxymyristoyl] glucosamine N-acyltransferase
MTAKEIAGLLGVETEAVTELTRVSAAEDARADCVVFAEDERSLAAAVASRAGLILARRGAESEDARVVEVDEPRYAFAVCARELGKLGLAETKAKIHPSAVIEDGAIMGEGCVIGPHVLFPQQGLLVIEDDVEIGANTTIDRGALGETRIGRGTKIDNQVHIGHNCIIGKNVVIAAQVGISGSCTVGDGVVMAGQVGLGDHVTIGPGVILGGASGVFPGKTLAGPGQMFMGVPAEPLKDYLKSVARVRRLKSSG